MKTFKIITLLITLGLFYSSSGAKAQSTLPDNYTTSNPPKVKELRIEKPSKTIDIDPAKALAPIQFYTNTFGNTVQSPTKYNKPPAGATAVCRDGTYSFSRHRQGTCSHHGGVARWL